jgi:hypothetical protein
MRRLILRAGLATAPLALFGAAGCTSGPLIDNAGLIQADFGPACPNPVFIPRGPNDYACVFEKVIDVISDTFEISEASRYDGRIKTHPKIAPGLEQPWKSGSPDLSERLLVTLQTYRYHAEVVITTGDHGGYLIYVTVYKELEDLPQPARATAGAAAFRSDNTVERQFEVVDPSVVEGNWIPKGRETHLEQTILQKIQKGLEVGKNCGCPGD